jgi:hypothetical protein
MGSVDSLTSIVHFKPLSVTLPGTLTLSRLNLPQTGIVILLTEDMGSYCERKYNCPTPSKENLNDPKTRWIVADDRKTG